MRDHVDVGDGAMVAACAAVANDVAGGTAVSGMPALPHRQSLREQAALRRSPIWSFTCQVAGRDQATPRPVAAGREIGRHLSTIGQAL